MVVEMSRAASALVGASQRDGDSHPGLPAYTARLEVSLQCASLLTRRIEKQLLPTSSGSWGLLAGSLPAGAGLFTQVTMETTFPRAALWISNSPFGSLPAGSRRAGTCCTSGTRLTGKIT